MERQDPDPYRFGVGTMWQVTPAIKVAAAYEYALSPDLNMNQFRGPLAGRVSSAYSNPSPNFLALNLSWQF